MEVMTKSYNNFKVSYFSLFFNFTSGSNILFSLLKPPVDFLADAWKILPSKPSRAFLACVDEKRSRGYREESDVWNCSD